MPIDDLILTWLSPEPYPAEPDTVFDDMDCPSCGYTGEMIIKEGRSFCPACFEIFPNSPAEALRRIVHCPNCDVEIMLLDGDRNKTIVCSHCKFFLGCIYRDEPSRQLEVFGIHLPSLLLYLPFIRREVPLRLRRLLRGVGSHGQKGLDAKAPFVDRSSGQRNSR